MENIDYTKIYEKELNEAIKKNNEKNFLTTLVDKSDNEITELYKKDKSKFTKKVLNYLIETKPHLHDRILTKSQYAELEPSAMLALLIYNPRLIDIDGVTVKTLSKMQIFQLVAKHPVFSVIVNWSEIECVDIAKILSLQPSIFNFVRSEFSRFDSISIVYLLSRNPTLVDFFDVSVLSKEDMTKLTNKHPKLKTYFQLNKI